MVCTLRRRFKRLALSNLSDFPDEKSPLARTSVLASWPHQLYIQPLPLAVSFHPFHPERLQRATKRGARPASSGYGKPEVAPLSTISLTPLHPLPCLAFFGRRRLRAGVEPALGLDSSRLLAGVLRSWLYLLRRRLIPAFGGHELLGYEKMIAVRVLQRLSPTAKWIASVRGHDRDHPIHECGAIQSDRKCGFRLFPSAARGSVSRRLQKSLQIDRSEVGAIVMARAARACGVETANHHSWQLPHEPNGSRKAAQPQVGSGVFGRAILDIHVPLGCLAEGAPPFDPDSVPRASGLSSIGSDDVPVPEGGGG